jgi:hypothetical protein
MRGPISEVVIIVILGFFIGGIAGAIIHFTFDNNAIVPHPASTTRSTRSIEAMTPRRFPPPWTVEELDAWLLLKTIR